MSALNIVYFDLETKRSAAEVGGWHRADLMGMSLGVTYSTKDEAYHIYTEDQAEDLINEMRQADLVVGFNHIGFDYQVLQPFTFWTIADVTKNLDICLDLGKKLGHRVNLDSFARPTLGGLSKTAKGTDALRWWRDYEKSGNVQAMMDIAKYCCYDVKVTMELYLFGAREGYVLYENKQGELNKVEVEWAL